MGPSHMINTILRRPLPNGTPPDRTSPQLRELHMIQGNVLAQIMLDMFTTMSTIPRLHGPKQLSAIFAHLIQIKLISGHESKQSLRPVQAKVWEEFAGPLVPPYPNSFRYSTSCFCSRATDPVGYPTKACLIRFGWTR